MLGLGMWQQSAASIGGSAVEVAAEEVAAVRDGKGLSFGSRERVLVANTNYLPPCGGSMRF